MDELESGGPLTDAALDGEIKLALAADPSPEFLTKARQRIASVSAPRRFWRMPVIAVATVALIAIGLLTLRSRPPDADEVPAAQLIVSTPVTGTFAGLAQGMSRNRAVAAASKVSPPVSIGSGRPARRPPDVVIAADEARALKRWMRIAPFGPVDPSALPARMTGNRALEPLKDVEFPPIPELRTIAIEPIHMTAREEGVRQ